MATIRVRDWTKERIEEIRDRESHSSYDSVIKSLLKDRELATFADATPDSRSAAESERVDASVDTAIDDLTVFAEVQRADSGVLFLWCPGCGTEIAHLSVENPVGIPIFEVECKNCLAHIDQHALVAIEIGYPLEQRLVENALEDDLTTCVVDYWNRALRNRVSDVDSEDVVDDERLVWQFDRYVGEFNWEWPPDVPVVGIDVGRTYRNEMTGEHLEVLEAVTENRNAPDAHRVRWYEPGTSPTAAEPEILDAETTTDLIINRDLIRIDEATRTAGD